MRTVILFLLTTFSFQISFAQINRTSILTEGTVIKIPITETGIYKLDFDYLKDAGLAVESSDPRNISIYGNGGGMMNGLIDTDYNQQEADLIENAVFVSGESDGIFNSGDYILFYAEAAAKRIFDNQNKRYSIPANRFDDENYYFVKIGNTPGKRVEVNSSTGTPTYSTTSFDDVIRYEKDDRNLLSDWVSGQGSGQHWYGDQFKNTRSRTYDSHFEFPNLVTSEPAEVRVRFVGRALGSGANYSVEVEGEEFVSNPFSRTLGKATDTYCYAQIIHEEVIVSDENITVKVDFPSTSFSSEGWLDYIEINARRRLQMTGDQMMFSDFESTEHAVSNFKVSAMDSDFEIWDITNPLSPRKQDGALSGNDFSFSTQTADQLKEFFVFNKSRGLLTPGEAVIVPNQNLHGTPDVDLAIIYHPDFEEAVMRLAEHRRELNGYDVATVPVAEICNEFSSGRIDPVGIRDFAKMLYDRNPQKFKYVLLFGDGSFDYRNINGDGGNFIPVYETIESHSPIDAYPADDYFGLLTSGEGRNLSGKLDVAVGRIPVSDAEEANAVVSKLINYDMSPSSMRDWRNRFTFVSDDNEDESGWLHVKPSEEHAALLDTAYSNFNVDKIYLDAFEQVATTGGQKYPSVNEAIDRTMFKGVLAINYFGHGGSKGWAQERVLKIENVLNWENYDRLPLFITATCSFTGYDEPTFKSAGEEVFLNPKGGAFALFSTTRAVYISGNERLVKGVFKVIFEKEDGKYGTIGEILARSKNESGAGYVNSRKFCLIGDPSMNLAIPEYNVATTRINGHDIINGEPDTLRALQEVTIEGMITDENGMFMSDFNGSIYPTIFDKKTEQTTLGNDPSNPIRNFELQKSVLFKGRATVENGQFKFSFVMPKDIDYAYGPGKISYYAEDGDKHDAWGNYKNVIIGQTDPEAISDNEGPVVEVFMNNEDFISGGITDENPVIYARLSDDTGINVAGTSIGHDLTAVLDENTQATFVMNDFYEAELNDYTKGVVKFPLSNLEEGSHHVKVTAWDVSNNFGEGSTEFVVAASEEVALLNVLNFPNPFVDQTCISFETNAANEELEVVIDIFAANGQLVKIIETTMTPTGYRLGTGECIPWDGTNDLGTPLAKGVYVYRVKIKGTGAAGIEKTSEFEKMVLLR